MRRRRVFVHEKIADEFTAIVQAEAPKYAPGDPLGGQNEIGALVDDTQMKTVLGYIEAGRSEGARLLMRRSTRDERDRRLLRRTHRVRRRQQQHADRTRRDLRPGALGHPLQGRSRSDPPGQRQQLRPAGQRLERQHQPRPPSSRGRCAPGTVHVNQYDEDDITVPFGGYKQSGNGRDKSLHAFDKYTELKTTWLRINA
jgi:gamma-glutamyl-gamma-aminobutyraldehyde dehydrogenase